MTLSLLWSVDGVYVILPYSSHRIIFDDSSIYYLNEIAVKKIPGICKKVVAHPIFLLNG